MPRVFRMIERKCLNCEYSRIYCDDNGHNKLICTLDMFEAVNVEYEHKCRLYKLMQSVEADNE